MLGAAPVVAFIPSLDLTRSGAFYTGVLPGFRSSLRMKCHGLGV